MIISTSPRRGAGPAPDGRPHVSTLTFSRVRALTFLALAILLGAAAALSPWSAPAAEARTTVLGSASPSDTSYDDDASLTVGIKFTPKTSGTVTGVRFYKGSGNTGTHVGALYSSSGQLLARATYGSETSTGWQSVSFSTPVRVTSGATYTAATFLPEGRYSVTSPYGWPDEGTDMTGLAGTYNYGGGLEFPSSTYGRSNYFVDVSFEAGTGAAPEPDPTTPPTSAPTPTTPPTSAPAPTTGFPSSASTGVPDGTSLSTYTGPSTITNDGTVIDSKKITSCIVIKADNVTIKNSLLQTGGCFFNVLSDDGNTGLKLTDVEIDGLGNTSGDAAIGGGGYTCLRCDIHGTTDGAKAGDDVVFRDSYIHDLAMTGGSHNDGIQSLGTDSLQIVHNRIITPRGSTSAIILSTGSADQMRNVKIDNNVLGGGAYTVYGGYLAGTDSLSKISNISITNNKFTTEVYSRSGAYGPLTSTSSPVVVSGNTWYDGPDAGKSVS